MDIPPDLNPRNNYLSQYNRKTKFIISLSVLGLILFLSVSAIAPFKDQLFSRLYPKPKSQAQEVSVVSGLTTQLLASRDSFNTASGVPLQESTISAQTNALTNMIDIASQRKIELFNELKQDPNLFLKDATLADQRSSFPPEVQGYIEEKTTVEGSSAVIILDNFEEKKSLTEYSVITSNNQKIILHPANQLPTPLVSGMTIKVNGLRLNNELAFDASQPNNLIVLQSPSVIPDSIGEQKVAVILANFQNTQQPNLTKEWVNDVIFNNVNSYYRETSYGKTNLTGTVFGWYALPINQSCDNAWDVLISALSIAAGDIDYTQYRGVIIIAPFGKCFWAGMGTVGKASLATPNGLVKMSVSWVNNASFPIDSPYYLGIISGIVAHEFGHNLELMHARFIDCGSVPIASSGCAVYEYGDYMDAMGAVSGIVGHFNAPHKDYLGWFASSNILTVLRSGTYILEPLETSSMGLKALKIPRKSGYLYLEYRQPIGFDERLRSYYLTGAWIHTTESSASNLYDMSVPPAEAVTASLLVGETYQDPETDTVITVKSRTDSALTIEVNIPFKPPPQPSVSYNTSCVNGVSYSGSEVTLSWKENAYPATRVEISSDPTFSSNIYLKLMSGSAGTSTSTLAPLNFSTTGDENGQAFIAQPGRIYYVRSYNGEYSQTSSFILNPCSCQVTGITCGISTTASITINNITLTDNGWGANGMAVYLQGGTRRIYTNFTSPYTVNYLTPNTPIDVKVGCYKDTGAAIPPTTGWSNTITCTTSPTPSPTPTPTPTSIPTPLPNTAISLDGQTSYVSINDNNQKLAVTENFTIEVWVKPQLILDGINQILTRYSPDHGTRYGISLNKNSGSEKIKLRFIVLSSSNMPIESLEIVPLDIWSHLAFVKEGNIIRGFINGQKVIEETPPLEPVDGNSSLTTIGAFRSGSYVGSRFKGMIDELRISNSARDITANWNAGIYSKPLPVDQNTLGLWRFEKDVKDSGPNYLDGTVSGNVSYNPGIVTELTPIPTLTPTSIPCILTSASWSTTITPKGSSVGLSVSGTDCQGKQVTFVVRRNGSSALDDIPANIQPTPVILNAFGQGDGTWIAEYNPLIPGTNPQYYFKATVSDSYTIESNPRLLTVIAPVPSPTPTPIPTSTPTSPPTSLPNIINIDTSIQIPDKIQL